MELITAIVGVEHQGVHAFKKINIPRPQLGELINDQDLIWKVTEIRLKTGQITIGIGVEPFDEESRTAVAEPTGKILEKAGWECFRPKAELN
jgi:hypothetical protein